MNQNEKDDMLEIEPIGSDIGLSQDVVAEETEDEKDDLGIAIPKAGDLKEMSTADIDKIVENAGDMVEKYLEQPQGLQAVADSILERRRREKEEYLKTNLETGLITQEQHDELMLKVAQDETPVGTLFTSLIQAMEVMGFRQQSIEHFKASHYFRESQYEGDEIQKHEFALYVNRLFVMTSEAKGVDPETNIVNMEKLAPVRTRMALVMNESVERWLEDMVAGVLPYLHANEDLYYPVEASEEAPVDVVEEPVAEQPAGEAIIEEQSQEQPGEMTAEPAPKAE